MKKNKVLPPPLQIYVSQAEKLVLLFSSFHKEYAMNNGKKIENIKIGRKQRRVIKHGPCS